MHCCFGFTICAKYTQLVALAYFLGILPSFPPLNSFQFVNIISGIWYVKLNTDEVFPIKTEQYIVCTVWGFFFFCSLKVSSRTATDYNVLIHVDEPSMPKACFLYWRRYCELELGYVPLLQKITWNSYSV